MEISTIAADTQIMRGINAAAVLSFLRRSGAVSVSELASATGLSRQAITRALTGLEVSRLVEMNAPDPTSARSGRPAQLAQFRADAGHLFGISVSTREIRLAITDLRGEIVARDLVALTTEPAVDTVRRAIGDLLATSGLEAGDIWAAAAAAPGIVDPHTGIIKLIPSMVELQGDVLVTCIRDALDCEVYLDNDVKLATEGEQWRAPRELSSLVLIEWGERIGAGIVLNGQLHRGASNDAGDIGFLDVVVDAAHATPRPGLGAFENWVGGAEVVDLTRAVAARNGDKQLLDSLAGLNDSDALEVVISAVQGGADSAVEAVSEVARRLVAGIAAVRALLDPELVIVGGPMARCGDILLEVMEASRASQILNQPELELSSLGDDAVLFGAIHHSLVDVEQRYFTPQALTEGLPASTAG